ncbi:MAG: tRNA (guanosine(46)-N7)-methyltransferase TrmB [Clostridia bacterium]|nr:tRNA (guanosine(46)-N7)-methyltransferase TrmB [Clostridia bacterium]
MRQRTIKNLDEKLSMNAKYRVLSPEELKGKWHEEFGNTNPVHIEIGSGKGKFITSMAKKNPDINYIAFEGQDDVSLRIMEKALSEEITNVRIVIAFVQDLHEYFEDEEIDGVYLSFSDPWPKGRHAKRRLTYHKRIENYIDVMKEGFIEFRTDNEDLFSFSLEELNLLGIKPKEVSYDFKAEITTEYEDKFSSMGKNILHYRVEF